MSKYKVLLPTNGHAPGDEVELTDDEANNYNAGEPTPRVELIAETPEPAAEPAPETPPAEPEAPAEGEPTGEPPVENKPEGEPAADAGNGEGEPEGAGDDEAK